MSKIVWKCQVECYWAYPDTTSRLFKVGDEVTLDSEGEIKPPKHFVLKKDWKETEKKLFRNNRVLGEGGRVARTFTDFAKEQQLMPAPLGMGAGLAQEENVVPVRKGRGKAKV